MQTFLEEIKQMMPGANMDIIQRAYLKAEEMHHGQKRKSGEDYIIHPIAVSVILAELGLDDTAVAAALLHDVVEDTDYSLAMLKADFGAEVASLVDGVTKLDSLVYENKEERQAENLRKMFLAMSKDIRVLLIKLADRLHNMRTLEFQSEEKTIEISKETLEIYAPLANRLGIFKIKFELENLSLKYLDKEAYMYLSDQIETELVDRKNNLDSTVIKLRASLDALGIKYDISARAKHYYSIYKKMKFQDKNVEEIFDIIGIRIVVETVADCYAVLGIVHTMWTPLPNRFKDYIAVPKANNYKSLHTTLLEKNGQPFEIQIRTYDMHRVAEYGIAAHWKYKEGIEKHSEEEKMSWLRQTLEWDKDMNDPKEFVEALKMDLFASQVFVLSPKGDIVDLPAGATPLDFAFKIHSQVGIKFTGAKVDGKMVPIDYVLKNGNMVEVITSNNSKGPSIDWLKVAKSNHTKTKIKQWLKKENRGETAERGKDTLERYIRRKGYDVSAIMTVARLNKISKLLGFPALEEMYSAIGYSGLQVNKAFVALLDQYNLEKQEEVKKAEKGQEDTLEIARKKSAKKTANGVVVRGVDNLLIRFSKCCTPVPGDPIVGFVTKGRGISVHRADCTNVISTPEEEKVRFLEVEWDIDKQSKSYDLEIVIMAENRKGIVAEISKALDELDIDISGINAKSGKDGAGRIDLMLAVNNIEQIEKALNKLRGVRGVREVYRAHN